MVDAHTVDADIVDVHMVDAHMVDAHMVDAHMVDAHMIDAQHQRTGCSLLNKPYFVIINGLNYKNPQAFQLVVPSTYQVCLNPSPVSQHPLT